jgi:hypothetical protein
MTILFVLDYDDTLFPSTEYSKRRFFHDYEKIKLKIILENLFANLEKFGNILLLTNANLEWVKLTSLDFFGYDISKRVFTFCAKENLERYYPIANWKKIYLEKFLPATNYTHILGFGDALSDRDAILHFSNNYLTKNFKFINNPTFEKLIMSLKTVMENLNQYIFTEEQLDWMIEIKSLETE